MTQLSNEAASRILGLLHQPEFRWTGCWFDMPPNPGYTIITSILPNPKVGSSYDVTEIQIGNDGRLRGGELIESKDTVHFTK